MTSARSFSRFFLPSFFDLSFTPSSFSLHHSFSFLLSSTFFTFLVSFGSLESNKGFGNCKKTNKQILTIRMQPAPSHSVPLVSPEQNAGSGTSGTRKKKKWKKGVDLRLQVLKKQVLKKQLVPGSLGYDSFFFLLSFPVLSEEIPVTSFQRRFELGAGLLFFQKGTKFSFFFSLFSL